MKRTDPAVPCANCDAPTQRWHRRQRLCSRCTRDTDVLALRAVELRAERLGRAFELTLADLRAMRRSGCAYCGDAANSFDRIDSHGGYTCDNVVPACNTCNLMKRRLSPEDFIRHAESITLDHFEAVRAAWLERPEPERDRRIEYDGDPGPTD